MLAFAACGSDAPPEPAAAGLLIVSGRNGADSVLGTTIPDLVVQVRASGGGLAAGVAVRFEAIRPSPLSLPILYVCATTKSMCEVSPSSFAFVGTTDSRGRAAIHVRPRYLAGTGWVRVTVPDLGFADSARYEIAPGGAAGLTRVVADTVVSIGGSITLSARTTDSFGNLRPDTVTLTGATGVVTVAAGSTLVQGTAFGMQAVYAQYGTLRDSTLVRVVPPARLLVWGAIERVLSFVNTDGSAVRRFLTDVTGPLGVFPRFSPARGLISLQRTTVEIGGSSNVFQVVDTLGAVQRELAPVVGFESILVTRVLADGTALAVARKTGFVQPGPYAFGTGYSVWRIAADNAITSLLDLPQLTVFAGVDVLYGSADISPDGRTLAYTAQPTPSAPTELRVVDIATGVTRTIDQRGAFAPRWSPSGSRIAYLTAIVGMSMTFGANVNTIAADGSNQTPIGSTLFTAGISWSPDGQYLLGRTNRAVLSILRVADGRAVALSLPGARPGVYEDYLQPDWR